MFRHFLLIVSAVAPIAASSNGWAQGATAATPSTTTTQPQAPTTPGSASAEPYAYNPDGRRDPFVSLLSPRVEAAPGVKLSGLGGMATADLMVRGVLQSRGSSVAIVSGPDGKTYRAHVNDRLLDGVIRSVTPQGIVIMQDVNDPLWLVKQREVRKGLRTAEDGK